jgi:O-antigen/teichoic acid export membrane protein
MEKTSRKTTTINNLVFYNVAVIISFINGIVIVPIYLKFIDIDLLGAWLATGSILVWLSIIDPGIGTVLQQRVAFSYGNSNIKNLSYTISSGIIISLVVSLIVLLVGLIISDYIPSILDISPNEIDTNELILAFKLAILGSFFTLFSYSFVNINRGLQDSTINHIVISSSQILSIIINIFLLFKGYGLVSIGYAQLVRGFGALAGNSIYLFVRIYKYKIPIIFDFKYFLSFSKIFTYTFISKTASTVANNIDLILIARYINPETVTMFEITRRPLKILNSFVSRPALAFLPTISHLAGNQNLGKLKPITQRFFFLFLFLVYPLIFGFIIFNKSLIPLWVGDDIYIGNMLNSLICLSFLIISFNYSISSFTFALGNIKGNSLIETFRSGLYIILLYIGAKHFGLVGVVLATIIAFVFSELWYYPKKIIDLLKFNWYDIKPIIGVNIKLIVTCSVLVILFFFLKITSLYYLIIIGILFLTSYMTIMWFFSKEFKLEVINGIMLIRKKIF